MNSPRLFQVPKICGRHECLKYRECAVSMATGEKDFYPEVRLEKNTVSDDHGAKLVCVEGK